MTPGKSNILLLFLLVFFLSGSVLARQGAGETWSFEFRGEQMSQALDVIAKETDMDLVYDPELIRDINVYIRLRDKTREELLLNLLKDHALDYLTLSSGTVVIVRTTRGSPAFGTFAGRVVDLQTGEPLPGATVMLADASGGTSTNRSGNFSMNRVISGTHEIIFSYVGYEPVYKIIHIRPEEQIRERVELRQKPVHVLPVLVEAHRPRLPAQNRNLDLNRQREWESAGVMRDAIRDLSLMPGLQYGLPMTDLHLQGGQRGEHRILLDGVPVYNPYSFGQMFSSFSPYAVGTIELHKAGYGVEQGSQIAGLIDLSHDLKPSGSNGATVQIDPLSLNLRGELSIPLRNESALNVMSALRTNFWNIYRDPVLESTIQDWDVIDPLITNMHIDIEGDAALYTPVRHESDVQFFDLHVAAAYSPDDFSTLYGSLYMAENSVGTTLLNQAAGGGGEGVPPYLYATDEHSWDNFMAQLSWNRMVTPRFDFSAQASYSANRFAHINRIGLSEAPFFPERFMIGSDIALQAFDSSSSLLPTQIDGNRIGHFILKADGAYSFTPRFSMDGGLKADRVFSEVDISDLTYLPTRTEESSTLLSGYLNNNHTFGNYWSLKYGTRFTYVTPSEKVFAEPRLSIQYDRPGSEIGYWSARLSGGLYRQFINEYQITNTGSTSLVPSFAIWSHAGNSPIPKAWHLNGSLLLEPAENTVLNLELFYKWQPVTNITSYGNLIQGEDIDRSEMRAFAETTEMTALGAGIRLNQTLANSRVQMVAGYDYSYARLDLDTQFGRPMPAPWNEPHRAQFRTLYRILPEVTIAAKWQGVWGRAWAFRPAYYNYLRFVDPGHTAEFSFDTPENDRLSTFQQVDFSVIYQPRVGVADLEIRLDLINILNRENRLEKSLQPVFIDGENVQYQSRYRTLPGFYPTASIQIIF